jgi:pimeloyl-ACP methyl ester carboxylesterase
MAAAKPTGRFSVFPIAPGGLEGLLWLPVAVGFFFSAVGFLVWVAVTARCVALAHWFRARAPFSWLSGLANRAPQPTMAATPATSRAYSSDRDHGCDTTPVLPPALPPARDLVLRHGRVRYVLAGNPVHARPVVVFLHGVSAFGCMWNEHMTALHRHGLCVLAFDLYGHGHSECPPDIAYEPRVFAAQLLEVLDALRVPRAALVGHSMGGLIATTFAALHPHRVSHLCLINAIGLPARVHTAAPTTMAAGYFRGVYQAMRLTGLRHTAARVGGKLLDEISRAVEVSHAQVLVSMAAQAAPTHGTVARVLRSLHMLVAMWAWQHQRTPRTGVFEGFLRAWNPFADYSAVVAAAGAHRFPTLLLWGAKDPLVPVTSMTRFLKLMPGAIAKHHPACDHNLPLQRPAFVINELLHFLRSGDLTPPFRTAAEDESETVM